jgi:hypothetical protein
MATAYQKRMMLRKQSDLTRIAEQYKKNIEAMTGQYQSEFAAYQNQRDELMAPYEAAVKQYREVQMPQYESAAAAYRQRLENFNNSLSDYEANPEQRQAVFQIVGGSPAAWQVKNLSTGKVGQMPSSAIDDLRSQGYEQDGSTFYKVTTRAVPKFNEKAPVAPAAPTAPQLPEFDQEKFEQQRAQLQTSYQREVGERKGARLAAVSRRTSRPLLKDA